VLMLSNEGGIHWLNMVTARRTASEAGEPWIETVVSASVNESSADRVAWCRRHGDRQIPIRRLFELAKRQGRIPRLAV
jgi:hypothetical protein